MTGNNYKVAWKSKATLKFSKLFNVDHRRVLRNSRYLLSANPYKYADGVADFPGYLFNGYFWINVNNVILIYRIHAEERLVSIESCYSALTGEVAEIFYEVSLDDEDSL
jgi:hypothetical protein